MLNTIDLFCGCGGMSLGFQNAGYNIIAAFDNWDAAIETYKKNFKHPVYKKDLIQTNNIDDIINLNPDLIIGGPPCQDFSSAGHRNENLGRADLTLSFANIIETIKPQFFIMENVPTIRKSEKLDIIMSIFKKNGYGITTTVLDASLCGVPQKRKRFFLIGELNGKDNALMSILTSNLSETPMSLFDYFGNSLGLEYYFRVPRSYSRRGIYSIYEPSMTIRGVDRPMPKGYLGHPNDPVPVSPDIRTLTYKERSLIQTFPLNFIFEGSKTILNQQIGNAVPVKLAEYVANCLNTYIANKDVK